MRLKSAVLLLLLLAFGHASTSGTWDCSMKKNTEFVKYPLLTQLLNSVPGKRFGEYRFLPFFFLLGEYIYRTIT
jgi:hypothetical protein